MNDEIFDEELKAIIGHRYEDISDKFTEEAQERRRNNRLLFTAKISVILVLIVNTLVWAFQAGLSSFGFTAMGITLCAAAIGYNVGICVCHNKGWRGA